MDIVEKHHYRLIELPNNSLTSASPDGSKSYKRKRTVINLCESAEEYEEELYEPPTADEFKNVFINKWVSNSIQFNKRIKLERNDPYLNRGFAGGKNPPLGRLPKMSAFDEDDEDGGGGGGGGERSDEDDFFGAAINREHSHQISATAATAATTGAHNLYKLNDFIDLEAICGGAGVETSGGGNGAGVDDNDDRLLDIFCSTPNFEFQQDNLIQRFTTTVSTIETELNDEGFDASLNQVAAHLRHAEQLVKQIPSEEATLVCGRNEPLTDVKQFELVSNDEDEATLSPVVEQPSVIEMIERPAAAASQAVVPASREARQSLRFDRVLRSYVASSKSVGSGFSIAINVPTSRRPKNREYDFFNFLQSRFKKQKQKIPKLPPF